MRYPALLLFAFGLAAAGCNREGVIPAATPVAAASASTRTTLGDATLQTSTVALADLNPATATRYGIDRSQAGVLLLVTVRDAAGNAIAPGDLQLTGTASVLPDPPAPLPLRAVSTDGMTDYLGIVPARAPASVQFRLTAVRGGARADIATTAELSPR
jgi:hypothetical protein